MDKQCISPTTVQRTVYLAQSAICYYGVFRRRYCTADCPPEFRWVSWTVHGLQVSIVVCVEVFGMVGLNCFYKTSSCFYLHRYSCFPVRFALVELATISLFFARVHAFFYQIKMNKIFLCETKHLKPCSDHEVQPTQVSHSPPSVIYSARTH